MCLISRSQLEDALADEKTLKDILPLSDENIDYMIKCKATWYALSFRSKTKHVWENFWRDFAPEQYHGELYEEYCNVLEAAFKECLESTFRRPHFNIGPYETREAP